MASPSSSATTDRILHRVRRKGVVRARDLKKDGLPPRSLRRLAENGTLERVGRGLYRHPEAPLTEHHSLALVAARYPDSPIALLSALQFHELTTQWPRKVWMARRPGAWTPEASPVDLEVTRMSGASFIEGVEHQLIEGVSVQIFGPAKTVADCFKFRNKVGLDVAIEALQSYLQTEDRSVEDLYRFAKICRVQTIMRPYIEASV